MTVAEIATEMIPLITDANTLAVQLNKMHFTTPITKVLALALLCFESMGGCPSAEMTVAEMRTRIRETIEMAYNPDLAQEHLDSNIMRMVAHLRKMDQPA